MGNAPISGSQQSPSKPGEKSRKPKGPPAPAEVLLLEAMAHVNRQATKIGSKLRTASPAKRAAYTRFVAKFGELAGVAEDLVEVDAINLPAPDQEG